MPSAARLRRWQRLAVFGIFVFAAVATPSQDPFSMLMLGIPMALLFELAILVAWIHDRRKARREAAEPFAELPDDVASPLDLSVERLEQRYARVSDHGRGERYDYAAPRFGYTGRLDYDEHGLILDYPGLAVRAG